MILVRDIFQIKFGKMRDALAIGKEMAAIEKKYGYAASRILTDLTGPYYTLVVESSYKNMSEFEKVMQETTKVDEWKSCYQKFVPFVESGQREIFTIVE